MKPPIARSTQESPGLRRQFADTVEVGSPAEAGTLVGGAVGQRLYDVIPSRLRRLPQGSILLVDLRAVRQASHAALREILSVLPAVRTSEFEAKYLLFHIALENEELVESLQVVARDQGEVIPVLGATGSWHAFGKLTKAEQDTLEAVLAIGEVTAAQISQRFHLPVSAASNRLRRLYTRRLVQREQRLIPGTGGREFVYQPLFS
jgi:hypothetical protein